MHVPVLAALLTLGLAGTPPGGQAEDRTKESYLSRLVEAQSRIVEQLEELAAFCRGRRLMLESHNCYRLILQFDEDHDVARRALRFSKRRGVWVQSASYREPRNLGDDAYQEYSARRLADFEEYKRAVFALNEDFADVVSLERRERTLLQLLDLTPDDPDVRRALGEAWVGDSWKLVETESSLRRSGLIPDLAERCIATSPSGEPDEPNGLEQVLELPWSLVLETPYVRVAGTGDPEEVRNVMKTTLGAAEFFRALLSNDAVPPPGFAVYLLTKDTEKRQFLDRHPRVKAADRPFLESLESAGIPRTGQTAEWSATEELRLDRSTRQTIGKLMVDTYGITTDHGWAWEGVGIYLTYQLIGTRLTYYLRPSAYGGDANAVELQQQLFDRMYTEGSDWLDEARIFFAERRPPKLPILMGRKVDTMNAQDLLWSYVLAAYLIEGWPDEAPRFLRAVGKRKLKPHEAVRQVFGMELPRFEQRVVRWLDETG